MLILINAIHTFGTLHDIDILVAFLSLPIIGSERKATRISISSSVFVIFFSDPLLSGTCVYTPVNCNDSNPCTTDYCYMNSLGNPLCANVPINCNDNNPCTTDRCVNGVCQHNPVVCNDGNGCTNDYCSLGVCHFVPVTCNDGNPCTTDTCDALNTTLYKCQFTPINCDDGNGCTKDLCAVNGSTNYRCEHLPITCFGSTLCNPISCHGNGTCVPSVFCVDDNLCTSDLCTVVQGKPTCNFKVKQSHNVVNILFSQFSVLIMMHAILKVAILPQVDATLLLSVAMIITSAPTTNARAS